MVSSALLFACVLPLLATAHDTHDPRYVAKLRARHPQVSAAVLNRRAPTETTTTVTSVRLRKSKPTPTANAQTATATDAIPLDQIGTSIRVEATSPLPRTFQAGAKSPIKGAPPLPAGIIDPTQWPALDLPPPVDSPEVQQWLSQIDMSLVPDIPPTQLGGCANASNADAVAEAEDRCWWSCGGCTRATDITFCPKPRTWGLSFDDGPSPDTPRLLDYLDEVKQKSTFFVVGSRAISRPDILQYEYMDGHQLSVHTWRSIIAEFGWTMKAIKEITGVTPSTMRPCFGDIDDRVRAISLQMGLTPIIWTSVGGKTFDTQDWQITAGVVTAAEVLTNFDNILSGADDLDTGFIVLQHDLYQQAVDLAVGYVLPQAATISPSLKLQPIIECLGKKMSDAYIETASTNATAGFPANAGAKPIAASPRAGSSGSGVILAVSPTAIPIGGATDVSCSLLGVVVAMMAVAVLK